VFSNDSIVIRNIPAPGSDWQFHTAWLSVMADESGSNRSPEKGLPSTSPSPSGNRAPATFPLNLLLVEDNLPDALIIREAIKKENLPVQVHIVADGEKALECIRAAEADPEALCPHFLLLDLNLPKVEGLEVLRAIRATAKFKQLPVVIVTSSDSPSDRNEVAKLGADYFRKPVSYLEFVKIGPFIRSFLEQHRLLQ
jgi:CheY-like chemotaxis protein